MWYMLGSHIKDRMDSVGVKGRRGGRWQFRWPLIPDLTLQSHPLTDRIRLNLPRLCICVENLPWGGNIKHNCEHLALAVWLINSFISLNGFIIQFPDMSYLFKNNKWSKPQSHYIYVFLKGVDEIVVCVVCVCVCIYMFFINYYWKL